MENFTCALVFLGVGLDPGPVLPTAESQLALPSKQTELFKTQALKVSQFLPTFDLHLFFLPAANTMKRTASFNPVYPFEEQTQPNTALPPFFSSDGLEEKPGGTLGLKITNPLGFDLDGNLKLKLGDGMRIDVNGALETDQSLTATNPLEITNDTLSLKMNSSSLFVNGSGELDMIHQQTLSAEQPLVIEDEKIKLKTNATLTTNNTGQLQINLHGSAPINVTNQNMISLDIDTKGLRIQDGKLKLAVQSPLYMTPDNFLTMETLTMWTGAGEEPNAQMNANQLNARVDLVLTKIGAMVQGMMRVTATGAPLLELDGYATPTDVSCSLFFDDQGVLNTTTSNLKGSFGFKVGSQVSTGYNQNLGFMPNILYYPKHASNLANSNLRVYDKFLIGNHPRDWQNKLLVFRMEYNGFPSNSYTGFSIRFNWSKFESDFKGLKTGWAKFSYLAQQ